MTSPPAVGEQATAGWADRRPGACAGSLNLAPTAVNTTITAAISFPAGRFATPPIVVASLGSSASTDVVVGVTSGTTSTGATIFLYAGTLTSRIINWIAVDPTY